MTKQRKIEYRQLEVGYEFPPTSYQLSPSMTAIYLSAVEETSRLYQYTELIPPMAIAAFAMAALSESISLPPGVIHVSQEVEFIDTVSIKDTFTSFAKVARKQKRGKLCLLTIDLTVFKEKQKAVLAGKTSFMLPEYVGDNEL